MHDHNAAQRKYSKKMKSVSFLVTHEEHQAATDYCAKKNMSFKQLFLEKISKLFTKNP